MLSFPRAALCWPVMMQACAFCSVLQSWQWMPTGSRVQPMMVVQPALLSSTWTLPLLVWSWVAALLTLDCSVFSVRRIILANNFCTLHSLKKCISFEHHLVVIVHNRPKSLRAHSFVLPFSGASHIQCLQPDISYLADNIYEKPKERSKSGFFCGGPVHSKAANTTA